MIKLTDTAYTIMWFKVSVHLAVIVDYRTNSTLVA